MDQKDKTKINIDNQSHKLYSQLKQSWMLVSRSDVLGQFMPLVGKDWTHTGIAHLFSAIKVVSLIILFYVPKAIFTFVGAFMSIQICMY